MVPLNSTSIFIYSLQIIELFSLFEHYFLLWIFIPLAVASFTLPPLADPNEHPHYCFCSGWKFSSRFFKRFTLFYLCFSAFDKPGYEYPEPNWIVFCSPANKFCNLFRFTFNSSPMHLVYKKPDSALLPLTWNQNIGRKLLATFRFGIEFKQLLSQIDRWNTSFSRLPGHNVA